MLEDVKSKVSTYNWLIPIRSLLVQSSHSRITHHHTKKQKMNGLQGVVKCVVSGDTVVLTHPKKLPPVEKTVTLAGIETPKLSRKDKSEEVCLKYMFV